MARDRGALVQLQYGLKFLARTHILGGDLAAAAPHRGGARIAEATDRPVAYTEMALAAWRGEGR